LARLSRFLPRDYNPVMDRFARIVLGYHGCAPDFADALIRGEVAIDAWTPSTNPYDWLGHGIYFWEHGPERARVWGSEGGVVGAVIQLGRCLDLTDVGYTRLLAIEYENVRATHEREGLILPTNRGKFRDLDCLVVNAVLNAAEETGLGFQTVRSPFLEGTPAFPGSGLLNESHIQITVRDRGSILGVFRPNYT